MSLDFSRKAEDVVKNCATPRTELQRRSQRTSYWGMRTGPWELLQKAQTTGGSHLVLCLRITSLESPSAAAF